MRKLTEEQVIYCRENYVAGDAARGLKVLAEKFGVSVDVMKSIVHGETYKNVGGKIHPIKERVPAAVKEAIAAEYVPNSSEHGVKALAEKYGVSIGTVQKCIAKSATRRTKLTPEVKAAIMAEYKPYVEGHGREALAEKYGVSVAAISYVIREMRKEPARRGKPALEVADYLKEAIIEAYDEGLTVRQMAERFSLNRDTIKNVLAEAGIQLRRRVDEDTKQEIIAAFKSGQSLRQLEEIYGINRATIADWVKDFKPVKEKKELTDQIREQIYRYHSQGYGAGIIAKTIGFPQSVVRRVIDGEL
ncbi:MAG: hypothetical protein SR1Q5_00840 [Quinella sp. 1Q5]|nr:hypothetical protein [Quinella sp. 1Q5]